jgi:hypothetical protein
VRHLSTAWAAADIAKFENWLMKVYYDFLTYSTIGIKGWDYSNGKVHNY